MEKPTGVFVYECKANCGAKPFKRTATEVAVAHRTVGWVKCPDCGGFCYCKGEIYKAE